MIELLKEAGDLYKIIADRKDTISDPKTYYNQHGMHVKQLSVDLVFTFEPLRERQKHNHETCKFDY